MKKAKRTFRSTKSRFSKTSFVTPSKTTRLKFLFFSFSVLICLARAALGGGTTLSGNVHVNRMKSDGSIWETYDTSFQLSLSGSKWQMTTGGGEDHSEVDGFDGTNLYSYFILTDHTIARLSEAGNAHPLAPAYISSSSYPFFNSDPAVQVLWFAFLSEPYLLISSNDLPSPWAKVGNTDLNGHLATLSNLRFNTGSPRWPVEAQFIYSSRAFLNRATNMAFISSSITADQIKKAGSDLKKLDNHPVAQYKVLSTTNFEDKTFPSSFEFDVVGEKGPPPLKLWIIESFVGTVTNVSGKMPQDPVPKPSVGLMVSDFRFSDGSRRIDDLRYSITNGEWPAKDAPELLERFEKLRASTPVYTQVNLRRVRLAFLIILLAGLPLVFAWLNRRFKKVNP